MHNNNVVYLSIKNLILSSVFLGLFYAKFIVIQDLEGVIDYWFGGRGLDVNEYHFTIVYKNIITVTKIIFSTLTVLTSLVLLDNTYKLYSLLKYLKNNKNNL